MERISGIIFLFLLLAAYGNGMVLSDSIGNRYFRNISVDEGLSQSTVFSIAQDTLGFMWLGTQDGLNRYDGRTFILYSPVNGNPNSLQSNYIRSVFLDKQGTLWVGGNKGISKYDYTANHFINFTLPRKSGEWYISSIAEDADGVLWAGSKSGQVFYLEKNATAFKRLNIDELSLNIQSIRVLLSADGILYIGTDTGLYTLHTGTKEISFVPGTSFVINDLMLDKNGLWIATEGDGLFQYHLKNKSIKQYIHKTADKNSLADNDVRSVTKDREGNVWLGTFRGLSILDTDGQAFRNYYHSPTVPYTIGQNSVRCIYKDKLGGMWLGTYYGGISYYHPNDIKFSLLSLNSGALSLNDPVVNVISQDEKGNFWIGTNDKGLNFWDRRSGRMSYYSHDELNPRSLSSNNIKAIVFDGAGNLLIGTHNVGLNHFNPQTGKNVIYRHDPEDPESITGDMVYTLVKDHNDQVWVGTKSGLDRFNPKSGTFTHMYLDKSGNRLTSDEITYMMEDSRKRIWIGTNKGINIFYPENLLFDPFSAVPEAGALSDDVVTCITEDTKGQIWIGTRNGLNLFDESTRTFKVYNTSHGLPNNIIYGVLPDDEGHLWISTNKGLVRFHPGNKKAQLFDSSDGLQSNQFNLYAFCKAADGMMLFGGIAGVSYFYPGAIKQDSLHLKLTFTGLEVFNTPVTPRDQHQTLDNHIDQAGLLTFTPGQKQFTIHFNAFNYISPNKISYQYKLEGYDGDWQVAEGTSEASYSNLRPGRYTFLARAVGPLGEHSDTRTLRIRVLPPWWQSNWFYLLIALFTAGSAYAAYRIITERLRTLHQLKIERIEREKNDSINKMKMEFFTNVSHEFRTPLTLILAPIEEILNKPTTDKSLKRQHQLIMLNARRLLFLVDQLMEFRKAELGTLKLRIRKGDLVSFIHEIYTSFMPLSDKNNVKYTFKSTEAKLSIPFDKSSMEKICFNLLSNAFKFTKEGGSVEISLSRSDDGFAVIKVTDSGVGIDEKEHQRIFDHFYQVNNIGMGSGVGLALTKRLVEEHHGQISVESLPGKGASFMVTLPLDDRLYTAEEYPDEAKELNPIEATLLVENEIPDIEDILQQGERKDTLLIVDDNTEILDYLRAHFLRNFDVMTASTGPEALAIVEETHLDLIVCDVMLPELDGIHFCKKIKQNIRTSHIPIILLTAKNELDQQIEGFEAGADDYVTKPFSISLLDVKINNIVRSRKRLKEYYSESKEIVPENIAFNTLDEEFLRDALGIVEENLAESDFSVDDFSKKIGMSRSNLYLKLKAVTGESATDFIKRIRFRKATELLESRRYTVAQIAYMCGFNTPSYFSTSFKQFFGYMPTEHISQLNKDNS